jgi:hypothetical protein
MRVHEFIIVHKTCSWTSSTQCLHLHVYKLIKIFNGVLKELEVGNTFIDMGVWVSWKCCASFNLLENCRNRSFRLVTKARAGKGVGQKWTPGVTFHDPGRLRLWEGGRIEPPHSQVNSHFGSWNPNGFPNFQRAIVGIKTHWIEDLFIPLESFWNVDVSNGLSWPIWTYKTQSYAKRRVENQTAKFDSRPLKVKNYPDYHACRWRATCRWKALNKFYNFALDLNSIGGL